MFVCYSLNNKLDAAFVIKCVCEDCSSDIQGNQSVSDILKKHSAFIIRSQEVKDLLDY